MKEYASQRLDETIEELDELIYQLSSKIDLAIQFIMEGEIEDDNLDVQLRSLEGHITNVSLERDTV